MDEYWKLVLRFEWMKLPVQNQLIDPIGKWLRRNECQLVSKIFKTEKKS